MSYTGVQFVTAVTMMTLTHLSAECPGVPRVCRRRRAARAAADSRVPAAAGQRQCSRQTATYPLPRTRSSARPTVATAERVRTTTGSDLQQHDIKV